MLKYWQRIGEAYKGVYQQPEPTEPRNSGDTPSRLLKAKAL